MRSGTGKVGALEYAFAGAKGFVRSNNEDNCIGLCAHGVFAVADGMGGGEAGEIASGLIVDTLRKGFGALGPDLKETFESRRELVQACLEEANDEIFEYSVRNEFNVMGSTFVGLVSDPEKPRRMAVCYVGDSRAYYFRDGDLVQVTEDHTVYNDYIRAGREAELASLSPKAQQALSRAVGVGRIVEEDWIELPLHRGDIVLLCTDGLTKMIDDKTIERILGSTSSLAGACSALLSFALSSGGRDNVTVLLVRAE